MGCLFELISEVFFELFLEVTVHCFKKIAFFLIPEHTLTQKAINRAESIIKFICALLLVVMIVGIVLLCCVDPDLKFAGLLLTLIPFGIFFVIFCAGLIARSVKKNRRKR